MNEVQSYPVDEAAVSRFFPEESGPMIGVKFKQDGKNAVTFSLADHLAWAVASKILALLDRDPCPADEIDALAGD